jgi:hypothetical protein
MSEPDYQCSDALDVADRLRARVQRWQEEHSIVPEDVVETLRMLREERDNELGQSGEPDNDT